MLLSLVVIIGHKKRGHHLAHVVVLGKPNRGTRLNPRAVTARVLTCLPPLFPYY